MINDVKPCTPAHPAPTVASRLLRAALRDARNQASATQKSVARALDWSAAKVMRIEGGEVNVSTTDLGALLSLLKVDGATGAGLVELARVARQAVWTARYRDIYPEEFISYLGYEAGSSRIFQLETQVVPALLQTESYARALFERLPDAHAECSESAVIDRKIDGQRQRQRIAKSEAPPTMMFMLDESVIRRTVGGPEVMVEQLGHLLRVAREPHVQLQVLPFSAGVTQAMAGPFAVLDFAWQGLGPLAFITDIRGAVPPVEVQDSGPLLDAVAGLQRVAASRLATIEHLRRAVERVKCRP